MKIFRSTLLVTATALFAAACGDKVVLPPTGPTGGNITNVIVAPGSATLTVGGTVNLTAAVTADAGVAYTVAWTSSDPTKASVGPTTGVVTALVATPGVAICAKATATVGASVQTGCASVIVQGLANPTPASVSIASITSSALGLNFPVPVPPGVVAGQIDVRININPGTVKLDSVTVFINGKNAGTQVLTAAQAAALRSAADAAVAAQAAIPTVIISVNTAKYDTTTGAPKYPNGQTNVTAVGFGKQGSVAAAPSASNTVGLLFGNGDAWIISQVLGSTLSAPSAAGFTFRTGSVAVSAIPVLYSGQGIGSATVNFGTAACDLSGAAQRTQPLTLPAAGTYAWTATFSRTPLAASGATNVNNYEYSAACPSNNGGGEGATVVASQYTNTNVGPAGPVGGTANPVVRLDNRAPIAPTVVINPNGRTNNWLNDAAQFTAIQTANPDGMIAAAVVDGGVGGVKYFAKAGASIATAVAAADITSPATTPLAASATNGTYCLMQYSQDALGNRSADPVGCATTFGVDRAAPTIAYDATSLAANARQFGASIGGEFVVTVSDTGLVGNSGMAPVAPVLMQITRRVASGNGVGTTTARNADGTLATTAGTQTATGVTNPGASLYSTAITASTQTGYYTHVATATDAAGNSSFITSATAVASRTIVYDAPAPTVSATATPISITGLGWTANAFVNDVLDIQSQWFSGDYAAATIAPKRLAQAQTAVNGFNAPSFLNTNYAMSQAINLPLELQPTATAVTLYPLTNVEANAINQGNLTTTGAAALAPTFTAPAAFVVGTATTMNAATGFTAPTLSSTSLSSGVTTTPVAAAPLSATITVTTVGATATFNNPFSRVDFYAATATEFRLIGTTTASALVDNGVTRVFTYSATLNGLAVYNTLGLAATTAQNVIAIGYNASGTVGMFSAAYSLNVIK